jgi:hypothetical protein
MRSTHPEHLPPEKLPGWLLERGACRDEAAAIGPSTVQVVDTLLGDPVIDRLPTVGRLLRLRKTYGDVRLEAACRRALHFGDPAYQTVKRILKEHLENEPLFEVPPMEPAARVFMRNVADLVGSALGGVSWS